jgi:hypothetical protein
MKTCTDCKKKLGYLDSKYEMSDGSVLCYKCYTDWSKKETEKKKKKQAREYQESKKSWFARHPIWTTIFVVMLVAIVIKDLNTGSSTSTVSNSYEPNYLREDLSSILVTFTNSNSPYTDLQKEELWKTNYKGKTIRGTAYVHDVDKNMIGQLVVLADASPRDEYKISSDYAIFFESSEKEKLVSIGKGSMIQFEGTLDDYHDTMKSLDIKSAVLLK